MGKFNLRNLKIGVVGLGYVGLPLAVEFGKRFTTVGFDIKADRVAELSKGVDSTLECDAKELAEAERLSYTTSLNDLKPCRRLHRHRADADRRVQAAGPDAAREVERVGRQGAEEGRRRRLRIDRLSRLHRRGLRPDPGAGLGPQVQQGLLRRLQPRADQSGRQGAPRPDHPQGDVGLDARSRGVRGPAVPHRSSLSGRTRRRASRWPRPPRSSRIRSATSTSR